MRKNKLEFLVGTFFLLVIFSGLSFAAEIQSMKVIKTGPPAVRSLPGMSPWVSRPVIVKTTYRCVPNDEWSIGDFEVDQQQDRWGEWITNEQYLEHNIEILCKRNKISRDIPNDETDFLIRMTKLRKAGNYLEIVGHYNERIKKYPNHASAYSGRGSAYLQLSDHQNALKDFDKAIEISPESWLGYMGKARSFAQVGNESEACKYLKIVKSKAPTEGVTAWKHTKKRLDGEKDFENIRSSACYKEIMAAD